MLLRCLPLLPVLACALSAAGTDLNQIKFVYLLPMSGALDQYLANRLVQTGRFQVVTDPSQADAVFTDRLGADFERQMEELYPPPAPPAEEKKPESEASSETEQKDLTIAAGLGEVADQVPPVRSSFSRGKGNVFLVDRQSRQVVWSRYVRPRSTRPDELDHVADEIVGKLADDAKRATKQPGAPGTPADETKPAAPPAGNSVPASPAPPPGTNAPASK